MGDRGLGQYFNLLKHRAELDGNSNSRFTPTDCLTLAASAGKYAEMHSRNCARALYPSDPTHPLSKQQEAAWAGCEARGICNGVHFVRARTLFLRVSKRMCETNARNTVCHLPATYTSLAKLRISIYFPSWAPVSSTWLFLGSASRSKN